MSFASHKLFRAVVVSGAALTGGCHRGDPVEPPKPEAAPLAPSASAPAAASSAPPAVEAIRDAGIADAMPDAHADAAKPKRDAGIAAPKKPPCPPGSETRYPPCWFIR